MLTEHLLWILKRKKKNIKRKLNIIDHLVRNKNIIIVDDSIVRLNTIKHIVKFVKRSRCQ